MSTINLLYKHQYDINDSIKIVIPTVGEIIEDEDNYYGIVSTLTAMPIDSMLILDKCGIDFTQINEYELFLLLFDSLKELDTHLIFGDLDLTKFETSVNSQNGNVVLYDADDDIVIDRAIHNKIAMTLREIHHLEKNNKKPANEEAKKYMIERAKKKAMRNKNRNAMSSLEQLIIAMVNTSEYKYNFEETKNLSIYQFNKSVEQIKRKIDYDNLMHGVYSGTVDTDKLSQKELNWIEIK